MNPHEVALQIAAKIVLEQVPPECVPTQQYTVTFGGDFLNILRKSYGELLKGGAK